MTALRWLGFIPAAVAAFVIAMMICSPLVPFAMNTLYGMWVENLPIQSSGEPQPLTSYWLARAVGEGLTAVFYGWVFMFVGWKVAPTMTKLPAYILFTLLGLFSAVRLATTLSRGQHMLTWVMLCVLAGGALFIWRWLPDLATQPAADDGGPARVTPNTPSEEPAP